MIIQKEQFEVLTDAAAKRFYSSLADHVREKFPFPANYVPRENLERLVNDATDKARTYGFQSTGPLRFFVDCAVLLGAAFDEDPLLFWVRDILLDRSDGDEMTRADRLHMHVDHYLTRVYGTRGALALHGLQQISTVSPGVLERVGSSSESLIAWLNGLHPEKCDYAGPEALESSVSSARAEAAREGFPPNQGAALIAGLKFAFGAGVFDDPLFPWLTTAWNNQEGTPEHRFSELERRSQAYLRRVLQVVTSVQGDGDGIRGV